MPLDNGKLIKILTYCLEKSASDIHFQTGKVPYIRVRGNFESLSEDALTQEDMIRLGTQLTGDKDFVRKSHSTPEVTGAFSFRELGRFRFIIFRHQNKLGIILRSLPLQTPTIESLNLSPLMSKVASFRRGIIVMSGVASSGKSNSVAALINHYNHTIPAHVITLEAPIEFIFEPKMCRFTQRTVEKDTESFAQALNFVPRQDPDIVYASWIPDYQSLQECISISESGHLVIFCISAPNVRKTISRLLSLVPSSEKMDMRQRLAENLRSVICQKLLPGRDKSKMVAAQEILILDEYTRDCIANEQQFAMFDSVMEQAEAQDSAVSFKTAIDFLHAHQKVSDSTKLIYVEDRADIGKVQTDFPRDTSVRSESATTPQPKSVVNKQNQKAKKINDEIDAAISQAPPVQPKPQVPPPPPAALLVEPQQATIQSSSEPPFASGPDTEKTEKSISSLIELDTSSSTGEIYSNPIASRAAALDPMSLVQKNAQNKPPSSSNASAIKPAPETSNPTSDTGFLDDVMPAISIEHEEGSEPAAIEFTDSQPTINSGDFQPQQENEIPPVTEASIVQTITDLEFEDTETEIEAEANIPRKKAS